MSHHRRHAAQASVKCAYCGRVDVPVTKKGHMKPHVKLDGRPCLLVNIPPRPRGEWGGRP